MQKIIRFTGDITRSRIESLMLRLQGSGSGQKVLIDSPGGTFEFFSVYGPRLRRQGFTSIGYDVRSAAIALHLLGRKRYVAPESSFSFHEVRAITPGGVITICDLEQALEYERSLSALKDGMEEMLRGLRNAQDWMLSFIKERTGLSKATFLSLMRDEAVLSAREAVRYGLAHQIVSLDEFLKT